MSDPPEPTVAVSVGLKYGRYINVEAGVDAPVVLLTFDTETQPPSTFALSPEQAAQLGRALSADPGE